MCESISGVETVLSTTIGPPKKEQDFDRLMAEIRDAGAGICSMKTVRLDPDFIGFTSGISICG